MKMIKVKLKRRVKWPFRKKEDKIVIETPLILASRYHFLKCGKWIYGREYFILKGKKDLASGVFTSFTPKRKFLELLFRKRIYVREE